MLYHLAPGFTHHTANDAICGKYNIFHRPDEAMLFVMVKACLHIQNILLFRTLKEFILIIKDQQYLGKPLKHFCRLYSYMLQLEDAVTHLWLNGSVGSHMPNLISPHGIALLAILVACGI